MKKTLFCMLLFSTAAFAEAPVKTLDCKIDPQHFMSFSATLDPNAFEPGSGYYTVTGAGVSYNYSSARLICSGATPDSIQCVGYWAGHTGDIAEVKTFIDDYGHLSAKFKTSAVYGHHDVTMPCEIK